MAVQILYIVEGKSACDALKRVLNPQKQQILAMQGKAPNAKRLSRKRILNNLHCQRLIETLGTGIEPDCYTRRMKFQRVILLTDADVDGVHSLSLLIKLFQVYFKALITDGYIFVLRPPLFRITSRYENFLAYAKDEQEKRKILQTCDFQCELTRFRGIAQLSVAEMSMLINHKPIKLQRYLNSDLSA